MCCFFFAFLLTVLPNSTFKQSNSSSIGTMSIPFNPNNLCTDFALLYYILNKFEPDKVASKSQKSTSHKIKSKSYNFFFFLQERRLIDGLSRLNSRLATKNPLKDSIFCWVNYAIQNKLEYKDSICCWVNYAIQRSLNIKIIEHIKLIQKLSLKSGNGSSRDQNIHSFFEQFYDLAPLETYIRYHNRDRSTKVLNVDTQL